MSSPLRISVTGAAGFLAPYVLQALHGLDAELVGVTGREPEMRVEGVTYRETLPVSDIVLHLGGRASIDRSVSDPFADLEANAAGTLRVLEAVRHMPAARLVLASSVAVYGDVEGVIDESVTPRPVVPYGVSKLAAEGYVRSYGRLHGVVGCIARLGNVYGPGQRQLVVFDLARRATTTGAPLVVRGTGSDVRDFVHAADAARALVRIALAGEPGEIYNIASGEPVTVRRVAELVAAAAGLGQDAVRADGQVRVGTTGVSRPSIEKIGRLGYEARVPLETGLAATVAWVRSNHA